MVSSNESLRLALLVDVFAARGFKRCKVGVWDPSTEIENLKSVLPSK